MSETEISYCRRCGEPVPPGKRVCLDCSMWFSKQQTYSATETYNPGQIPHSWVPLEELTIYKEALRMMAEDFVRPWYTEATDEKIAITCQNYIEKAKGKIK